MVCSSFSDLNLECVEEALQGAKAIHLEEYKVFGKTGAL